jgi:hypothetical protein
MQNLHNELVSEVFQGEGQSLIDCLVEYIGLLSKEPEQLSNAFSVLGKLSKLYSADRH